MLLWFHSLEILNIDSTVFKVLVKGTLVFLFLDLIEDIILRLTILEIDLDSHFLSCKDF